MKSGKVEGTNLMYEEFSSLNEFCKYLEETPINNAFRWARHGSVEGSYSFTQTNSYQEAHDLLKNGWDEMAEKLTQRLKASDMSVEKYVKQITTFDVCGYQACVPRYLQGIPTNMVSKKSVVVKQRVITINKCINYPGSTETEQMIEESVKAFKIIRKIEAQGVRVNLNVILGTKENVGFIVKVRVKNSSERLNVAKMAFVLCHPSMLRRMFFRFIEVYPKTTRQFVSGYGMPIADWQMKMACKGEYYLPPFIGYGIDDLKDMKMFYADK